MSETNRTTIESYNAHITEYVDGTPHEVTGSVKEWVDASLEGLPHNAKILEFGTAHGRDADYIEQQGFAVERTDASQGFVNLQTSQGKQARLFDALTDDIPYGYDLVFANAVLLHFNREEAATVAKKVCDALTENGRFAFTLKKGEGEGWSEEKLGAPRFFCYWEREGIAQLLSDAGFGQILIGEDAVSGHSNAKWLHVMASKS